MGDQAPNDIAADDLLASFPSLRALGPVPEPEDTWGTVALSRFPPEAKTGTLDNGLKWIVHENREPKSRAELYLVVGFGSLVETEEERGIAHIIEHLGFSATKAYENHQIVKFLETIGAPFGACQNAYTSFDRTVYTLHVPTDKEDLLSQSLKVLREFAYYTRISEADLDKERKVVLEEWRESRNAQGRLYEQYLTALCRGCRWCDRLPIGTEEVIKGVSSETLRRFYAKFYHPARMSVVAVGDFNGDEVAAQIRDLFDVAPGDISPLPRAPEAPERPMYAVPDTPGVLVAASTDPELSYSQGIMDCKRARRPMSSVQAFRRCVAEDIFHKALGSRMLKLTMEPKGPRNFFDVSTETGSPIPPLSPMTAQFAPLPGRMRHAMRSVVEEIERVKRMGFHESEVSRAKRSILAEYEEFYIEREQRSSSGIADEYVGVLLDDIPAPGPEEQARIVATVVPSITLDEVAKVASEFDFSTNVVVKISTPPLSVRNPLYTCWSLMQSAWNLTLPRPRMDLPSGPELEQLLTEVRGMELEQWPEDEDDVETRIQRRFESRAHLCRGAGGIPAADLGKKLRPVVAPGVPAPKRGVPVDLQRPACDGEAKDAPLGEEVFLKNGMRVFLKETDLFDDEILLQGRRWGGLSNHMESGFMGGPAVSCEAQTSSQVAMMLGIAGLSVEELQECLDGRRVQPNPPQMEAYTTDLSATSSPSDLEVLLMLLHLLFQCPVETSDKSKSRVSLVKLGMLAWRLAENRDPSALYNQRVQKCITQDHPYSRLPTLWSILRLNFGTACDVFNERASDPCQWTMVLVGRLPERVRLVEMLDRYLGSIPNSAAAERAFRGKEVDPRAYEVAARLAVQPLEIKFPSKSVRDDVRLKMISPKGSTLVCFPVQLSTVTQADSPVETVEAEQREIFELRMTMRMVETRLVEVLRFKRGQVYSVSASASLSLSPPRMGTRQTGTISISFECDPTETDELVEATLEELTKLREGQAAFTNENAAAAIEQFRREYEELFQKNDFWASVVMDLYFSRCFVLTGDVGTAAGLWWRVCCDVLASFDEERATAMLRKALPADATSAVVAMRPKGKVPSGSALAGAGDDGDAS